MAGPVVAGGLPPLLPTPTSCLFLTPRRAPWYAIRKVPGRASLSQNWNEDKRTGGGVSSDRRKEGWTGKNYQLPSFPRLNLEGNRLGRAGAGESTSDIQRLSRPAWRNEAKRSASRAPSADRSEKKARPPTEPEKQRYGGPTFTLSPMEAKASPPPADEYDAFELDTDKFAGPTFWFTSPEPSQVPIPCFLKAH